MNKQETLQKIKQSIAEGNYLAAELLLDDYAKSYQPQNTPTDEELLEKQCWSINEIMEECDRINFRYERVDIVDVNVLRGKLLSRLKSNYK